MLIVRTQTGACLSPARRRKACIQCEDAIGRSLRDCSTSTGGSRESAMFGLYQRPGAAPILTVEEERLQHCASARRDLHHVTRNPPQIAVAGGDKSRIAHRRGRQIGNLLEIAAVHTDGKQVRASLAIDAENPVKIAVHSLRYRDFEEVELGQGQDQGVLTRRRDPVKGSGDDTVEVSILGLNESRGKCSIGVVVEGMYSGIRAGGDVVLENRTAATNAAATEGTPRRSCPRTDCRPKWRSARLGSGRPHSWRRSRTDARF